MALKTKNDDNDESSDDEDTKLKSYITKLKAQICTKTQELV